MFFELSLELFGEAALYQSPDVRQQFDA